MDGNRFDRLARSVAGRTTRRGMLAGLLGGLGLLLPGAAPTDARSRRGPAVHAEKRRRKKCQSGLLTCKLKRRKKKAKIFCIDGQNDPFNCGGCGNTCATGQICLGGVCTCNGTLCSGCCHENTCEAGASNQRCGTNGGVCQGCTGGSSCRNGVCTCPNGLSYCAGACVDTKTDAANCGSCGTTCTSPQTCGGGNPGTPGVCGCSKLTCQAGQCSNPPDGCGGTLNCGACDGGESGNETCGGGGVPNVCGCLANGVEFPFAGSCDPCCSGQCCENSQGFIACAGACG